MLTHQSRGTKPKMSAGKVAIPGTGHASPIIWEDKIFIQTAIKVEERENGI